MKKGIILLEVLVSLVILATGVVFLMQTLSAIVQSNQAVQMNSLAVLEIDNMVSRLSAQEPVTNQTIYAPDEKGFSYRQETILIHNILKEVLLKIDWTSRNKTQSVEYSFSVIDVENNL